MAKKRRASRTDELSKARIVAAAIELLDAEGESALTFRSLATRLATGSGALYWHVTDKDTLLAAAAHEIITQILVGIDKRMTPKKTIRAIAAGVFDAIDAHPWVGAQLSREPWQSAIVEIFESVGAPLAAFGVPKRARFHAASALVNYMLGLAGQYAAGARRLPRDADRSTILASIAARWEQFDAQSHPFVSEMSARLRDHDDRAQFLAGIDLILRGIESL